MSLGDLRHVGNPRRFPTQRLERDRWPGRELWWIWQHPALATLLAIGGLGEIAVALQGCWS